MGYGFPALLAYAFAASFVLGLLKTSRWKAVLIAVLAVWGVRLGQTEVDLLATGTPQAYAWFAFLAAGVWFPTFVVAMVGCDLGGRLHRALFAKDTPDEPAVQAPAAPDEEAAEQ